VPWLPMVSGAGHDSQVMASRVPTAMLFVPSVDGRSHSAAEYTSPEDAARGATVLAAALHRLAY
jgi:allantoate deiminase